jgi:hypothetical protein
MDIILWGGCLTISKELTHKFIQTMKGWDPSDLKEDDSDDDSDYEDCWVDYQRDPLYVGADQEYSSLEIVNELDTTLLRHNNGTEDSGNCLRKRKERSQTFACSEEQCLLNETSVTISTGVLKMCTLWRF